MAQPPHHLDQAPQGAPPRWLPGGSLSLKPCGRFAPTPTGALHVGNAYTALLAHISARARGYQSVLRLDDLDPRATPRGCVEAQLADLEWLGLAYDESPQRPGARGPYDQGSRGPLYAEALDHLNQLGLIYECRCTRRELAALAPHASDEGVIYPGLCRPSAPIAERAPLELNQERGGASLPPALRFDLVGAVMSGLLPRVLSFRDEVMGAQRFDLITEVGDFVVRRRDGVHAYQLACVVDDVSQRCALVLRGADLLTSTARQLALARCLEVPEPLIPSYAHVGLVVDARGERLAKRRQSTQLLGVREAGHSPEALIESLSRAWGAPRPSGTLAELIEGFEMSSLPRSAVRWSLSASPQDAQL